MLSARVLGGLEAFRGKLCTPLPLAPKMRVLWDFHAVFEPFLQTFVSSPTLHFWKTKIHPISHAVQDPAFLRRNPRCSLPFTQLKTQHTLLSIQRKNPKAPYFLSKTKIRHGKPKASILPSHSVFIFTCIKNTHLKINPSLAFSHPMIPKTTSCISRH